MRGGRLQRQEHQEKPRSARAPLPDAGTCADQEPTHEELSPSGPLELFLLDYDRELVYLQHEGRLRSGQRPTGFKR